MVATYSGDHRAPIHPVHAVLLAGTVPLFLGALLSDLAYRSSFQVQWTNFASWLTAGGLLFGALALLWALVDLFRPSRRGARSLLYFLLLLGTCAIALISSLVHAKDAWGSMPEGLTLSLIVTVLAIAATWLGFSTLRAGTKR